MKYKRSFCDLSHSHNTTCKMGQLFPVLCLEAVPGDTFYLKTEGLVRLQALISPSFDNIRCKFEYFFVPLRLIWDDFEAFITGGVDGNAVPVFPTINSGTNGFAVGSLPNHLGVVANVPNMNIGALQMRALNFIYNDWYINQNVEEPRVISKASGPDTTTDLSMMYRSWKLDRFTACLPWAQRGDPVFLPFATQAPVVGNGMTLGLTTGVQNAGLQGVSTGNNNLNASLAAYGRPVNSAVDATQTAINTLGVTRDATKSGLIADLTSASAIDVDSLRAAVQMQLAKALMARGGSRYIEMIQSFFGVRVPDYRLDRSQFIGGGSSIVSISEVLQTSSTNNTSPQGNMAGHGISYNRTPKAKYFCNEYGFVICMASVVPDAIYFQGVPRQFLRRTRWDMPMPIFQHLGEQAVTLKEIYAQADSVVDSSGQPVNNQTFGFEGRYNELRRMYSVNSGQFVDTLKFWTLAREFSAPPALNSTFVKCKPSTRIFADQSPDAYDPVMLSCYHTIGAKIPFTKRPVPGYMDHYR